MKRAGDGVEPTGDITSRSGVAAVEDAVHLAASSPVAAGGAVAALVVDTRARADPGGTVRLIGAHPCGIVPRCPGWPAGG